MQPALLQLSHRSGSVAIAPFFRGLISFSTAHVAGLCLRVGNDVPCLFHAGKFMMLQDLVKLLRAGAKRQLRAAVDTRYCVRRKMLDRVLSAGALSDAPNREWHHGRAGID
jgi:hypothetical protein